MSSASTVPRKRAIIRVVIAAVVALAVLGAAVLLASWLRTLTGVQSFMASYPGRSALPSWAPVGLPAWVGWQHFLNALFLLLIIRSGWAVRTTKRPPAYWTRKNTGLLRTASAPTRISLDLWLHLSLDVLFVLNGIVFYLLIFSTGQWVRLVPVNWDIFPNAISTAISYASLHWPLESGWTNYNALQVLSYFVIVFVAAPLAIITGLRMSPAWPKSATRVNAAYRIELARALHFPTMLFFLAFVFVHVVLVLTTGALNNLNHMYASRNDESWIGFIIFAISLVVLVVAWFVVRATILRPVASLMGKVTR